MSFFIKSPGALSTIQDMGAVGHLADGFPAAGAMDRYSAALANILVGNGTGEAVVEMTMKGMCITFLDRTVFAVTGADMSPTLDRQNIPMNAAVTAHPGGVLELGFARTGCRAYLALRGGIDVPRVFGSRSTNLRCSFGGYYGRKLEEGDVIPVIPTHPLPESAVSVRSLPYNGVGGKNISVRAIPGPQDYMFTPAALETFFSAPYTVSPESDRMGIRLSGEVLESRDGVDIISDGIVFGSVQGPRSGLPIVLMADRQTTGGYAKIATVIEADLPHLAQARPGDTVRFTLTDSKAATAALGEMRAVLAQTAATLDAKSKQRR